MLPLISCICPTRDRRQYIPGAIRCFLNQTWPNKELIIVDDGDSDHIGDVIPSDSRIRYYRADGIRLSIGAKRNSACKVARGEYVAHWDDDDLSHPLRLKEQHKLLLSYQRGLVGYNSMVFIDEEERKAFLYNGATDYALGTSFFYRYTTWKAYHFPDRQMAEDSGFIDAAKGVLSVPAGNRMIARIHSGNTSPKRAFTDSWIPQDYEHAMRIAEGCKG